MESELLGIFLSKSGRQKYDVMCLFEEANKFSEPSCYT